MDADLNKKLRDELRQLLRDVAAEEEFKQRPEEVILEFWKHQYRSGASYGSFQRGYLTLWALGEFALARTWMHFSLLTEDLEKRRVIREFDRSPEEMYESSYILLYFLVTGNLTRAGEMWQAHAKWKKKITKTDILWDDKLIMKVLNRKEEFEDLTYETIRLDKENLEGFKQKCTDEKEIKLYTGHSATGKAETMFLLEEYERCQTFLDRFLEGVSLRKRDATPDRLLLYSTELSLAEGFLNWLKLKHITKEYELRLYSRKAINNFERYGLIHPLKGQLYAMWVRAEFGRDSSLLEEFLTHFKHLVLTYRPARALIQDMDVEYKDYMIPEKIKDAFTSLQKDKLRNAG